MRIASSSASTFASRTQYDIKYVGNDALMPIPTCQAPESEKVITVDGSIIMASTSRRSAFPITRE